ncbi:MAG: hypothetical protein F6K63_09755 [Moorea sp. SIO1G6]|uniref:Uncharacterized protein n=1 Tax=Moorena producens 3L TaxID=489825 RepID=F4XMW1_9CYAN|nr:hypothetical protein [Moorena producens]EGJ34020.1 hypothetical protein LYNGBM3L_22940 [Moorena producens 3L]NET64658.1 hypothetical protein [Moorena sp. SIO1G6]
MLFIKGFTISPLGQGAKKSIAQDDFSLEGQLWVKMQTLEIADGLVLT